MDVTARDIHDKQFHDAWRGYNQEEVDDFLDDVADALDDLARANASLTQRVGELEAAVATSRSTEEMLKKTLVTAQNAAEEAIAKAKARAEQLITEAEERARRADDEARDRTASLEADIRRRNLEADRDHTIRKRELDASIARLQTFERELRDKLKGFLEQNLRALEAMARPAEPPRVVPPAGPRSIPEPSDAAANR
jgi:cell division initiation protein